MYSASFCGNYFTGIVCNLECSMIQNFIMPLNPEPWRVPPMSAVRSKHGGKLFVKSGRDEAMVAFQEAVREELVAQGAQVDRPPYRIQFWFWRNLSPRMKEIDATNMQKACEDALQGLVISNDRFVRHITTNNMDQGAATPGMILIRVEGDYHSNDTLPPEMQGEVDKLYNSLLSGIGTQAFEEFKLDNTWP